MKIVVKERQKLINQYAQFASISIIKKFMVCLVVAVIFSNAILFQRMEQTSLRTNNESMKRLANLKNADEESISRLPLLNYSTNSTVLVANETSVDAITTFQLATNKTRFAYAFYASDYNYACSVLVNIAQLYAVGKHKSIDIVLMTMKTKPLPLWVTAKAAELNVTVVKVDAMPPPSGHSGYYKDVMGKMEVFSLVQYDRVVFLDADTIILKNLDHLFLLPETEIACPRAYWVGQPFVTTLMMVVQPSLETRKRLHETYYTMNAGVLRPKTKLYDMDMVNKEWKETMMVLPGIYGALNSHWENPHKEPKIYPNLGHRSPDDLARDVFSVHFTGLGKPWNYKPGTVAKIRSTSAPFFKFLYQKWWDVATDVCSAETRFK
jgi:hypothetical protein